MFRKVPLIIFIAIILTVLIPLYTPAYAQESESECWAVIVGVSDYKRIEDLYYSDDDARELSQQLSPAWGADHIKLLLDSEATKVNIKSAVDWLASNEDASDTVLFYFSGHGSPKGYLAPYNAYYKETWISSYELMKWLSMLDSEKIVIVLDTCYAGQYETKLGDSGRVVLMSSSSDEVGWSAGELRHCIFTYHLLEALSEFDDADANHDYRLSAEEIFQYAEPETVSLTTEWHTDSSKYSIQHPIMADGYSGELSLLIKFVFSIEPDLPSGTEILVLDDKTYSSVPPPFIWAPGSAHELEVPSLVDTGQSTRYVFTSWDDGETSVARTISHGGVYTANYKKQYQLTIEPAFGGPRGEGWYDSGSTATVSVASIEEATVKHIFTGWSGDFTSDAATASLTMDSPKVITANWRTDYLLTIESAYGGPGGEGWYESGSAAMISVAPVEGIIIRQVFTGWSGDYSGDTATVSIVMDSPKAITANWRTDYTQLYILIAGIMVLVGAITIIIMVVRTHRRKYL